MNSYVFSKVLFAFGEWWNNFQLNLLRAAGYTILFVILAVLLPRYIPTYLAMMALPPLVDEDNLEKLLQVLMDDHEYKITGLSFLDAAKSFQDKKRQDVVSNRSEMRALLVLAEILGDRTDLVSETGKPD